MKHQRRILIITYYWPPAGGPGVQRILKFVKYLPQLGWKPLILTVKNGNYPALDKTLEQDIPEDVEIYKTTSLEPHYLYKKFINTKEAIPVAVLARNNLDRKTRFAHWIRLNLFIPDAMIGWISPAFRKACRIIKKENIDLILSSSPPPTVHLIAHKLKKKFRIKWVADFRDPWTGIHYYRNSKKTLWAKRRDEYLEKKILNSCDKVITASRMFQKLLLLKPGQECITVTNGFDDEVENVKPEQLSGFSLVHMGGISTNRFYPGFFNSLKFFLDDPIKRKDTKLILIGSINQEILDKIKAVIPADVLDVRGYLPHNSALSIMKGASLNLIFLESLNNYKGHIPAKIFEYIAVKQPVLGIGDSQGDSANIILKSGCGKVYSPGSDWYNLFNKEYYNWKNDIRPNVDEDFIARFHRSKLTKNLTDILDKLL